MWQNSECDKTKKLKIWRKKSKKWKCDKILKLEIGPNSKTQNVTELKPPNCDTTKKKSKCDKAQKFKIWQN